MTLLQPGDRFPDLTVNTLDGELALPETQGGEFGVVLFNRGAWCPYCVGQLRAFQRALPKLVEAGASVAALWVDDEDTTRKFVETNRITFPVGYGADAAVLAETTGAFVNSDPVFVQSTGFILDANGDVLISVYSSGAIGRLVPDDVVGMIQYLASQH